MTTDSNKHMWKPTVPAVSIASPNHKLRITNQKKDGFKGAEMACLRRWMNRGAGGQRGNPCTDASA